MIRIKKIENTSSEDIYFDIILVEAMTTKDITSNYDIYTQEAFRMLNQTYHEGTAKFYNQYDELITGKDFFDYWNYAANTFVKAGKDCYKIYELITDDAATNVRSFTQAPQSIDYKQDLSKKLQVKYSFDNGFLTGATYFEDVAIVNNPETGLSSLEYSNEILKVEIQYVIGDDEYVSYRTTVRSWMKMDNTYDDNHSKVTIKYYDKKQAREEGIRRRGNIVDNLVLDTVGLIVFTEGLSVPAATELATPLLNDVDSEMNKYLKGSKGPLLEFINTTSSYSWLDNWVPGTGNTVSIRQYILSKLNI